MAKKLVVNDFWLVVKDGWDSCKYRGLTKNSKETASLFSSRVEWPIRLGDTQTFCLRLLQSSALASALAIIALLPSLQNMLWIWTYTWT